MNCPAKRSARFLDFTAPGLVRAGISVICPCTLLQNTAVGADITIDKPHANSELVVISITGEIRPGDNIVFAGLAMGAKQIWLNLNSPGGDVAAAIGIGSEVRRRDGIVSTDGCYSSCVLIFAGGVTRIGSGILDNPVVGVHRIFFADLPAGLTSTQVKTIYDAQLNRVRNYLAQLNVAPELLSFMQSICPLRIMCIVSMPAMRMRAQRKTLNPSIGRTLTVRGHSRPQFLRL